MATDRTRTRKPGSDASNANGTRLAVLARLSPVFHHELVGAIAPISINLQLGKSLLQRPEPDMARLGQVVEQADGAIVAARKRFENLIGWLTGEATSRRGPPRSLQAIVADAVNQLRLELALRQVTIEQTADDTPLTGIADRDLLYLLVAAMLAAIDQYPDLNLLRVATRQADGRIAVDISWGVSGMGGADMGPETARLDWEGVIALAEQLGLTVTLDEATRQFGASKTQPGH